MSFYYLCSPYTIYPHGLEAAFKLACEQTALLNRAGVDVFSPIVHSHSVAVIGGLDPLDHAMWMRLDQPFMEAAHGAIMLEADSWEKSKGMKMEHEYFCLANKPVFYMAPGWVPACLKRTYP